MLIEAEIIEDEDWFSLKSNSVWETKKPLSSQSIPAETPRAASEFYP